jgi:hypothetical protein
VTDLAQAKLAEARRREGEAAAAAAGEAARADALEKDLGLALRELEALRAR